MPAHLPGHLPRYVIEAATIADAAQVRALYRDVAANGAGLARAADEISLPYVRQFLRSAQRSGICLLARCATDQRLCGEIHACAPGPRVFAHVLGELTIAVHPRCQGQGVGRALFTALLAAARDLQPKVERVELLVRESNQRAVALYQSLGFEIEGRLKGRIARADGGREADLPMAWRPN